MFHQYYDFRLTAAEVQAWQAGRETLADRARPIEQRRRFFTVSPYSEPRLCRYRASMRWPPTVSFPFNAGFRARARLPIRHYPHRDPVQLERRCRLRAAMMADAENRSHWSRPDQHHWSQGDWQSFIVPDDHPDLRTGSRGPRCPSSASPTTSRNRTSEPRSASPTPASCRRSTACARDIPTAAILRASADGANGCKVLGGHLPELSHEPLKLYAHTRSSRTCRLVAITNALVQEQSFMHRTFLFHATQELSRNSSCASIHFTPTRSLIFSVVFWLTGGGQFSRLYEKSVFLDVGRATLHDS